MGRFLFEIATAHGYTDSAMRVAIRLLAALGAFVLAVVSGAPTVRLSGASVYVNEVLVLTLKAGSNEKRAASVAESFRKLEPDSELTLEGDSRTMRIKDGDRVVLTVARLEAKAHNLSVADLAKGWLNNLRKAIAVAPIVLPADTIKLPLGASRTFELGGSAVLKTEVQSDDAKIATATRSGTKLLILAKNYGDANLTLTAGESVKNIRVRVLPFAATLPQSFTMAVTGDPALPETVRGALETALWTRFQSAPGTESTFKLPEVSSINPEESKTFTIPVKVGGEDAFPVEGQITVTIRNEAIAYRAESDLWYCNEPENVSRFQNLFAAELSANQPVRLLYHHLNTMATSLEIDAKAINESDKPARLLVLPGDKRDRNPVLAGLMAGDQLLRSWIRFSGEVVTIPPRSSVSLALRKLAPQETLSGLAYVRLLPGGPAKVLFRVDSVPFDGDDARLDAASSAAPWRRLAPEALNGRTSDRLTISKHIYPYPFKTEAVDFTVGGRHGFVRIGQKPISRPEGKGLDGNFGVFYTIEAKVDNPLPDPVDIEVVFEASAGYSGAIFVVNGEVKRTPLLQPKEELQIMKIRLQPGEKKQFTFMTVPLSGSSYPATIVVRPVSVAYKIPRIKG